MDVVTHTCPSCGAALSFGIDSQSWDCAFCGSTYTLNQLKEQELGNNADPRGQENIREEDAAVYECPSCGGRVITDKNTAATFCVYCHNPTIIASRLKGEGRPETIIPFKLKKEEAVSAVQKLCKGKPLLPKAFRDSVQNGEVSGLYVPFWLFDSDLTAHLEATGKKIQTWSDAKYIYTKTDTYSVVRSGEMAVSNVPADGSGKMDDKLMESMEPFDYGEMREFAMEYISGHYAETFDVAADQAEKRALPRIRDGAAGLIRQQVQGYSGVQVNRLDVTPRSLRHRYAMLPVWTLMHEYNGKRYYFAMNGQTGKMVGKLPVSWFRAGLLFAAAWLGAFGLLGLAAVLI